MSDSISQRDRIGRGTTTASHYLWIALPLVTGAALAPALMRQGLPVLYPFIQSEFGLSLAQVGLISSALAIGSTAVVLLAGWLADKFGVKRMTIISLFSLSAFTLAFPLAYSFSFLFALVLIVGIVSSPVMPATTRAVMDWFPNRIRGLAMSIKQMGMPIAGALMAAVLPTLDQPALATEVFVELLVETLWIPNPKMCGDSWPGYICPPHEIKGITPAHMTSKQLAAAGKSGYKALPA